jgi:hypothetical protein
VEVSVEVVMGTIRSHSSGRAAGCKPTLHAETPCNPRETNTRPYDSIFGLIMFLPTEHFKHELQEARVRMHWPHYSHSGGYLKHETMFTLWDIVSGLGCVFQAPCAPVRTIIAIIRHKLLVLDKAQRENWIAPPQDNNY